MYAPCPWPHHHLQRGIHVTLNSIATRQFHILNHCSCSVVQNVVTITASPVVTSNAGLQFFMHTTTHTTLSGYSPCNAHPFGNRISWSCIILCLPTPYFNIYSHVVNGASTFITYDNMLQKSSPSIQYHCSKIIHVGLYPPVQCFGNQPAYILWYQSSWLKAHADIQLTTHLSATFLMTSHLSSWTRILNCLTVLDVVRRPTWLPSTTFVLPLWNLSSVRHEV